LSSVDVTEAFTLCSIAGGNVSDWSLLHRTEPPKVTKLVFLASVLKQLYILQVIKISKAFGRAFQFSPSTRQHDWIRA
jgi:hypothetical protein